MLALHEAYGEERDPNKKVEIFNQLTQMDEAVYFRYKQSFNDPAVPEGKESQKRSMREKKSIYGPNVGKEGGNPEYKKTVIQLEQERIEKQKQELLMKRKRNSNYIQKCIKMGNEYYNNEKIASLNWLKKSKENPSAHIDEGYKYVDDKRTNVLRRKQEILAKYNQISVENKPNEEEGLYKYQIIRGNNSSLVQRVLDTRPNWSELENRHLTIFQFKWAPVSRCINYEQLNIHK